MRQEGAGLADPTIHEQREIARRVAAIFTLADAIEKRVQAATAHADKITKSILGRAFRGELVPTEAELGRRDGRDEPASYLLARFCAARFGAQRATRDATIGHSMSLASRLRGSLY